MDLHCIHHVLVAIPLGSDEHARAFFGGLLGLVEVAKPPHLAGRGGVWYRCGPVDLHLGVDAEFRPAQKAHIAFFVPDLAGLRRRLRDAGVHTWEDEPLPRHKRFYAHDPFGNRLEFVEPEGPA